MPKKPRRSGLKIAPTSRRIKSERASLAELKASDLTAFNSSAEASFRSLICKLIAMEGPLSPRDVLSEAAFELNISTETVKCYLLKHTARRAHFSYTDGGKITCPCARARRELRPAGRRAADGARRGDPFGDPLVKRILMRKIADCNGGHRRASG